MNVLIVNGGPRKNWNTMKLLEEVKNGTTELGANTEVIHLYDYTYKGCISCFACKRKGNKTNGLCAYNDELTNVLQKAREADIIICGSPVYFSYPTGEFRSFLERFLFPLNTYMIDESTKERVNINKKFIPTALIYTMNVSEEAMVSMGYENILKPNEVFFNRIFGYSETMYSCDTYQFDDYDKYDCNVFDKEKKLESKNTKFVEDCKRAYELGKKLVQLKMEER